MSDPIAKTASGLTASGLTTSGLTTSGLTTSVIVGMIIPVRNRLAYTQALLTQLTQQIKSQAGKHSLHIIVVDDGSTDGTPELISQHFSDVYLIRGDGNLWWTGAIAQGMIYATEQLNANYLLWLNDDIVVADDFVTQVIWQCQRTWLRKTITGGIICHQQYRNWIVFGGVRASQQISNMADFEQTPLLKADTLNGNITLMPAQIVAEVGLPDVMRFRHYGGDYEYICRAKAAGYSIELSSYLQAQTDHSANDVIRYMPLWIQWYLSGSWAQKWQVLENLNSLKSPHNVKHMVNSIHRMDSKVPQWKYLVFYLKKVVKIVGSELVPASMRQHHIRQYLENNNVPSEMIQLVLTSDIKYASAETLKS
jgi:GT2 family glycosyltransferase